MMSKETLTSFRKRRIAKSEMKGVCGVRGNLRKRVTLCRDGCKKCDHKHWDLLKHCSEGPTELADTRDGGAQNKLDSCLATNRNALVANHVQEDAVGSTGSGTSDFDDTNCEKCGRDDDDARMLLCDKCNRGFHMYCLSPVVLYVPQGNWFCPLCSQSRKIPDIPNVQTKIADFFRIQKLPSRFPNFVVKKRRKQSGGFTVQKKGRKLLPHVPSKDLERRLEQMTSLATALASSGISFSDELTYLPGQAPRSSNSPSKEKGGMQVMGKDDLAAFNLCKEMCRLGYGPPLMVKHDPREGFVVEADSAIKDLTIIAEYTGDVDFMCNRMSDEGNSIMGLLFTENSREDLVICPDKRGNLARFVSGINNHSPYGRKKLNVRCVRFDVEGQARALLVAIRDIAMGERLYYDYNGYQHDYPTADFV